MSKLQRIYRPQSAEDSAMIALRNTSARAGHTWHSLTSGRAQKRAMMLCLLETLLQTFTGIVLFAEVLGKTHLQLNAERICTVIIYATFYFLQRNKCPSEVNQITDIFV